MTAQYRNDYSAGYSGSSRFGSVMRQDYANWGYIILYLLIIVCSLIGNSLFLLTIKKNPNLRHTPHFLLASLAVRDLLVTVLVVPFVLDSQAVNLMEWKAGDVMCKFFSFLNYGTIATHAFTLVFLLLFLYFWYRKNESYVTEEGQIVVRKTRMHKWSIPLVWVIGLGLAIPAGAIAVSQFNSHTGVRTCSVWDGRGNSSNGFKVAVSMVFVAFVVPLFILVFPCIALGMQLFGCREPKLDPPHNRTALTAVMLVVIFLGTLSPYQVYEAMKLFHQSPSGLKVNTLWGTPYASWTFNTDIIINAVVYLACMLNPMLYFMVNPDYRTGVVVVLRDFSCNKDSTQRGRDQDSKRRQRNMQRQYQQAASTGNRSIIKNRTPEHTRSNQEALLQSQLQTQPQIMPAGPGQPSYYPYPHGGQMQQQQVPLLPMGQTPILFPNQHFVDTSFDSTALHRSQSPQLPPVFEYNDFKYIDTARVEPKIAYSPGKTPPKTPETPHFGHKPFREPLDAMVINFQQHQAPQDAIPMQMISPPHVSPPIATSEPKRNCSNSMEVEELDYSPGNTLRDRERRKLLASSPPVSPVESPQPVEILQESPGSRQRTRRNLDSGKQPPINSHTNGHMHVTNSNHPMTTLTEGFSGREHDVRPSSRASGVEIVITGRTQSRTDLCPDVPRSKYEHSV